MQRTFYSVLVVLLIPFAAWPQEEKAPATELLEAARSLAAQAPTARRTHIEGRLSAAKVPYERLPFVDAKLKGVNLELKFGPDAGPALVLAAHHDVRAGSKGGNDDASGCAVLLALAAELQSKKDLLRPVRIVFLDGSQKGLLGARAWCEARQNVEVAQVLVFDLCGRGDRLVIGSSLQPYANAAPQLCPDAVSFQGDLPTDHKAFVAAGLDAAFVSVCPAKDIDMLQARYDRRDLRAPLPTHLSDALRGSDSGDDLEEGALALAFQAAVSAVAMSQTENRLGRMPRTDFAERMKGLDDALKSGDLALARKAALELGPAAFIEVLARPCGDEDRELKQSNALRLAAGAALRDLIVAIMADSKKSMSLAIDAKSRIRQTKEQFSLSD